MIDGGLDYLLEKWIEVVRAVDDRRTLWHWEKWLDDLDAREILEDVLDGVPDTAVARREVEEADRRFRRRAVRTSECVWGHDTARTRGWTPEKSWWYWTEPPTPYLSPFGRARLTVDDIVPGHTLGIAAVGADAGAIAVEYWIRPQLAAAPAVLRMSAVDVLGREYIDQGGLTSTIASCTYTTGVRSLFPLPRARAQRLTLQVGTSDAPARGSLAVELPLPYLYRAGNRDAGY